MIQRTTSRNVHVRLAFMAAVLTAGCAGSMAVQTCRPLPKPAAVSVTSGLVTLAADAATVAPGKTLTLTVRATGPATYFADCTTPVVFSITDTSGLAIDTSASLEFDPAPCGAISLASGQQAVYTAHWTPDATLPSGAYVIAAQAADQPSLQLHETIRTAQGGC